MLVGEFVSRVIGGTKKSRFLFGDTDRSVVEPSQKNLAPASSKGVSPVFSAVQTILNSTGTKE